MKKTFKIVEDIQTSSIKERALPSELFEKYTKKLNTNYMVLIEDSAFKDLKSHIKWGDNHTPTNRNEQGGLLLGAIYHDSKRKLTYGIVTEILFSHETDSSSISLEMGHDTWKGMLNEYDSKYSKKDDCYLIGWYHTHPNNLDVFMSGVDKNTQRRFFNQEWHCAIVLNPHKKIWKVFHSKEAVECQGINYQSENKKHQEIKRKVFIEDKSPLIIKKKLKDTNTLIGFTNIILIISFLIAFVYGLNEVINFNTITKEISKQKTSPLPLTKEISKQKTSPLPLTKEISKQKTSPLPLTKGNSIFYIKEEKHTINIYVKKHTYIKSKNKNGKTTDTIIKIKNLNIAIYYNSLNSCKSKLKDYDCFTTHR